MPYVLLYKGLKDGKNGRKFTYNTIHKSVLERIGTKTDRELKRE
jgi:hypothetical protein